MISSENEQPTGVSKDDCAFGAMVLWRLLSSQPLPQQDSDQFVALFGAAAQQVIAAADGQDTRQLLDAVTQLTDLSPLFNKYYVACLFDAAVFPQPTATRQEQVAQLHELVAAIDDTTGGPEEWLRVMLREPNLPGVPHTVLIDVKKRLGRSDPAL